jgi:hypothetical protein
VCLIVWIYKPQQWGGLRPIRDVAPQKKKKKMVGWLLNDKLEKDLKAIEVASRHLPRGPQKQRRTWVLKGPQYDFWRKHEPETSLGISLMTRPRAGQPKNCGSNLDRGQRFFSSRKRSDRFWSPPSLLPIGYTGCSFRGVKLILDVNLVPISRMSGSIPPLKHTSSWRAQGQLLQLYTSKQLLTRNAHTGYTSRY